MLPLHLADPSLIPGLLSRLIPAPVAPVTRAVADGAGGCLAEDLVLRHPVPAMDRAARDGWAVRAVETAGASAYAPAPVADAIWVEAGAPLPAGTDAVLQPFEVEGREPLLTALAEAVAGDGICQAAADAEAPLLLRRAGESLRALDLPLLAAAGIATLPLRQPRVALLPVGNEILDDPALDSLSPFLASLIAREGAAARRLPPVADEPARIAQALRAGATEADLLLALGGTGAGRGDHTASGLSLAGETVLHGLGTRPGYSAGLGSVAGRPVVLVPGHAADAFACWLLLARPALRRLSDVAPAPLRPARLARKVASAVGMAEVVLLRRGEEAGVVEPLATGTLPLGALAAAQAVLVVPPASEGYEAGRWVEVEDI
jgi:molybdenum cofactor synthesis domain-containing protein